jgi:hypothetical protein
VSDVDDEHRLAVVRGMAARTGRRAELRLDCLTKVNDLDPLYPQRNGCQASPTPDWCGDLPHLGGGLREDLMLPEPLGTRFLAAQ